ncbi:uncharacterized protein P174DRAFT_287260 [Aspergillus novofumigatus IBT 16806]|uniref:EF-hand domain-containing protein n=1 Tax=Aspergillus novofumigatus (strain IBT 16806) TaxID=1392255 RepID=A0A2I1BX22_ASPN1|nr:uncharacterized protein P174DRAFT_287260 [Aspergillus novofumigatus IBT 16806]PKX89934.1 hypothetical protein P174DRAFT_287260 [Aspergillus novofumigatus IBT 16806]
MATAGFQIRPFEYTSQTSTKPSTVPTVAPTTRKEDSFRRRSRTFCKYDHNNDGALTVRELFNLMHSHRCAADPFGWGAAFFEWGTTWLLIQKDARVYKEDHQGDYDVNLHVC